MKAVLNGTVIAEAPQEDLVKIEGNWYFPPAAVNSDLLVKSPTQYTCSWKGECQYFSVTDGDSLSEDRAFSYPAPPRASFDRVGQDYSNYVAFARDVTVA